MRFIARAFAGLMVSFLVIEELPRIFYIVVGQRLLSAAGWIRGTETPTYYTVLTIATSVIGATLSGVIAAMIVKRSRIPYSLACGLLLTTITIIRYRATLFPPQDLDAWPATLSPAISMPIGAWLAGHMRFIRESENAVPE
jgi:hypothetical protein